MQKNKHILFLLFFVFSLYSTVLSLQLCPVNCLFCLEGQKCITCQNQYYLTTQDKCIQKSVQNCRVYLQTDKCAICQPTFKTSNNQCVKDLTGCIQRDKLGVCQQCGYGTTLNIKGQCLGVINCISPQKDCKQCRTGYQLINNRCIYSGTDCQIIQSNGLCTQCKQGFILNGFQCVSKASNAVANGNINLIEKCNLYSRNQNQCFQCQNGYTLFNNLCKSNGQVYITTTDQADKKIKQKSADTYIDTTSEFIMYQKATYSLSNQKDDVLQGKYKQVDRITFQGIGTKPEDDGNCLIRAPNSAACSVCIDGYYYFNGLCKKKTPVCLKYDFKTNKCSLCHQNFALVDGYCSDPNCEQNLYAQCQKCKIGFSINEEGYCTDSNCFTRKQGVCIKCSAGYTLDQNMFCSKVIEGCITYNSIKNGCTQCQDNYTLTSDGLCKKIIDQRCVRYDSSNFQQCVQCRDQFALINGGCVDLYCKIFESAKKCQTCKEGYILHANFYCYDQNCVLYKNGTCINCANNYKLQNDYCVKNIVGCSSVQTLSQKCIKCIDLYRLLDGACIIADSDRCLKYTNNVCVSCKVQFAFVNGVCVNLLCEKEQFVNNFYACIQCKPGFNISSKGVCYDQNCLISVNGSCTRCADTYIIGPNGLCVKKTIACLNWNQKQQKCKQCYKGYIIGKNGICTIDPFQVNGSNNNGSSLNVINGSITDNGSGSNSGSTSNGIPNNNNSTNGSNNNVTINNTTNTVNGGNSSSTNNTSSANNSTVSNNNTSNNTSGSKSNTSNNTSGSKSNSSTITVNPLPSVIDNTDTLTIDEIDGTKKTQNDLNCKSYDQKNNCLICTGGRYYIRSGRCEAVPDICKTYNMKTGKCTSCETGYSPYTQIQNGYQNCVKKITQTDANCVIKNLDYFCIKCKPNYYIKVGLCYPADTLCKTFSLYGGQCLTCYDGYTLEQAKCIPLTKQAKCKTYDFQNVCIQCQDKFYVDNGICKETTLNCLSYDMQTGICLSCTIGFWPSNGQCIKIKDPVLNCKNTNELGNCIECLDRFYIDSATLTCKQVNSLCNDYNKNNGLCLNCSSGYKLRSDLGLCVVQSSEDFCSSFNENGKCVKCQDEYIFTKQQKCVKTNPLCDSYNQVTGDCQKCKDAYYLSFKQCIPKFKRDSLDINCLIGDSFSFCIKCKEGYFINAGNCLKASDQCKTFNVNTGACQTCYDGFVIQNRDCVSSILISSLSNNNCEVQSGIICIKCKSQFYLSYDFNPPSCVNVNPLCKTYNEFNGNCYTCIDGYEISNGNCIRTKTSTYVEVPQIKCKQFDLPSKTCITCYMGYFYYIVQSICKAVSTDCKTYNPTNGWCTSCFQGFYLNKSMCVYSSSNSIKQSQDVLTLNTSVNKLYCQKYDQTASKCITCYSRYQLLSTGLCSVMGSNVINDPYCTAVTDKVCVNCLAGYFVDIKTGLCTLQALLCGNFNVLGGQCYNCKAGAVLQDGVCFKPALGVDPYCTFYDGAYCYKCASGYKLTSFICVPNNQ